MKMKCKIWFPLLIISGLLFILTSSCNKDNNTTTICFKNSSDYLVTNINLAGENVGNLAGGKRSRLVTVTPGKITVNWSWSQYEMGLIANKTQTISGITMVAGTSAIFVWDGSNYSIQ